MRLVPTVPACAAHLARLPPHQRALIAQRRESCFVVPLRPKFVGKRVDNEAKAQIVTCILVLGERIRFFPAFSHTNAKESKINS